MKIRRYKTARRILSFYKINFGLRKPYQIIVDGTFCQAALKGKVQLKEQLPKYLGGPVQIVTTKCILRELQRLGSELHGARLVARQFKPRLCGHKDSVPAAECIDSFVGDTNENHYCVASQDHELRQKLRKRPGVPLLHIIRNTIVLESPSAATKTESDQVSCIKLEPSNYQKTVMSKLNDSLPTIEIKKRGKRKRAAAPNPLSVKKSTKTLVPDRPSRGVVTESKKRRVRMQRRKAIEKIAIALANEKQL